METQGRRDGVIGLSPASQEDLLVGFEPRSKAEANAHAFGLEGIQHLKASMCGQRPLLVTLADSSTCLSTENHAGTIHPGGHEDR